MDDPDIFTVNVQRQRLIKSERWQGLWRRRWMLLFPKGLLGFESLADFTGCDDCRGWTENLVPACMVVVKVGVNDVARAIALELLKFPDKFVGHWGEVIVDEEDAIGADEGCHVSAGTFQHVQ